MDNSEAVKRKVPLAALREGESGTVVSILPSHGRGRCYGFVRRVMEMGLTPGTRITVVSSAPFHGPVEVLVRGSRLALGRGVAERIIVEVDEHNG
jgi:DtxR family Mn-dependent transcriptional regulator